MARITVVEDADQLAEVGARRVTALLDEAFTRQPTASLVLTGGHTPERLYERLAAERIDWARVHVLWGDERQVPPDHPDSNYGMAYRTLLSRISIPSGHIHRVQGELADPHEAARLYQEEIRDWTFDVMLLGVGDDAHIASIFPDLAGREGLPHSSDLAGREGPRRKTDLESSGAGLYGLRDRVLAVPHDDYWRITLTPSAILDARAILVITAGASKADAVYAALNAPLDVSRYPAQLVRDREWLIDRAAARRLDVPPAQSA